MRGNLSSRRGIRKATICKIEKKISEKIQHIARNICREWKTGKLKPVLQLTSRNSPKFHG
jgi:predicted lipoprotein